MKNRIRHLLDHSAPTPPDAATETAVDRPPSPPPLPRGVNMLMPVKLGINRELLISLLSASIQQIHNLKQALASSAPARALVEAEVTLRQLLAFGAWARQHPATVISIAMYPVTEVGSVEDLDDLEELQGGP